MSPNPDDRPEQTNEAEDLARQIASKSRQIKALQREVAQLEQRQRQMKRRQMVQVPALPSVPTAEASKRTSIHSLSKRFEYSLLALLVLVAFLIRVYQLGSFPDTVLADEADNAQDSIRILYGSPPVNGFFGLDWTNQPAFSAYKEAAFIALFGFSIFAMRLSSAVISTCYGCACHKCLVSELLTQWLELHRYLFLYVNDDALPAVGRRCRDL